MSGSVGFSGSQPPTSQLSLTGSSAGSALTKMLLADDITPGSDPSYELCKTILLYHPLGAKMAEAPVNLAQSQKREISIPDAPDKVKEAFEREWEDMKADRLIFNVHRLARAYGIASLVVGAEEMATNEPFDPPDKYASESIYFNVLDPLNTSGSLVLNQQPNSPEFQRATQVTTNGQTYHKSRCCIVMNEEPIYIAYTASAFGYVGRSVYQRALFPMKSFIQSMITDDMIMRKAGVLIAKQVSPGSIVSKLMTSIAAMKRQLLKQAQTDNVLSIGVEESIETLNMMNIDGAGTYARTNVLKNIATAADMPAVLLENETMVSGFGEGTEDAKNIARYVERFRHEMAPTYAFMDNICQHRAWNQAFFKSMQQAYPDRYGRKKYAAVLSEWQRDFAAPWPSLLLEPESERVKTDDIKLKAIVAVIEALMPAMDPDNKARLLEWATDNIADTKLLFSVPLNLDLDAMIEFLEEQQAQQQAMAEQGPPGAGGGEQGGPGMPAGANNPNKEPAPPKNFNLARAA